MTAMIKVKRLSLNQTLCEEMRALNVSAFMLAKDTNKHDWQVRDDLNNNYLSKSKFDRYQKDLLHVMKLLRTTGGVINA